MPPKAAFSALTSVSGPKMIVEPVSVTVYADELITVDPTLTLFK